MSNKVRFFIAWSLLGLAATIFVFVVLVTLCIAWQGAGFYPLFAVILVPLVIYGLRWNSRVLVPAKWNFVYEWNGSILDPLTPGLYFPFPYFGLLSEGVEVPMNNQMIHILTGTRDGLTPEEVGQYEYGTSSNIEPGTGDFLRLKYKVEIQCINPVDLVYNQTEPYAYIAGLIESKINKYAHGKTSEQIIDGFSKRNWNKILLEKIRGEVLIAVGINLVSFIPVDVLLTLEIEDFRRALDLEDRKLEMIDKEADNYVRKEEGKKRILTARLDNKAVEKEIANKDNQIKVEAINAIKNGVGVNSVMALKMAMKEKTLETIATAAANGSVTYIDESGAGDNTTSQAAKFGWGVKSTNPTVLK